jgi:acyl carrier protein
VNKGTMDEILIRVLGIANSHLESYGYASISDPDQELTSAGFDSLTKIKFILEIERAFSLEFTPEFLDAGNFHSCRAAARSVRDYLELIATRPNTKFPI